MWGNISTEASYQLNFNFGFSTTRSDVIIHLSQWQYWWWFWFAYMWCVYYFITVRIVRLRTLKMNPKINTSMRPHGKWGDFLVAILPTIWCINILTNSNLILRLVEWQNESSLFTVRIRAKQWYWIYKFELKSFTDILTVPKNIGTNKWVLSTFGDIQQADDYLHILQLRLQNNWVKQYWKDILTTESKGRRPLYNLVNYQNVYSLVSQNNSNLDHSYLPSFHDYFINSEIISSSYKSNGDFFSELFAKKLELNLLSNYTHSISSNFYVKHRNLILFDKFFNISDDSYLTLNKRYFDKYNNTNKKQLKRSLGTTSPCRLLKLPLGLISADSNTTNLFRLRFGTGSNVLNHKPLPHNTYLTLKQLRYQRKLNLPLTKRTLYLNDNENSANVMLSRGVLINNSEIIHSFDKIYNNYRSVMRSRKFNDLIPLNLARRLLRTRRTLVLPAHVNITLITNSYDVVHSWFIPGLGVKLDAVPGRSTHHTFHIDNVGFYYGQCAEICGRYHHHMPIRLCALPFEHFLVWWNSFGLTRLLGLKNNRVDSVNYSFRKYVW